MLLAGTVAALLSSTAPSAPATAAEWAAAYARPSVGAPVDAAGRRLSFGHLTLELAGGRLYPLRVAGQPAGVYFSGTGRMRYVSGDAWEVSTFRRNAEKVSDYRLGHQGEIEDEISEALVVSSAPLLESGGGEADVEGAQRLARHLERWSLDLATRYTEIMPHARLEPPTQPPVLAEIQASRHDVLHVYDTLRSRQESFAVVKKAEDQPYLGDRRLAWTLSLQPIDGSRLDRRREPWVLRRLDATVVNPRGDALQVTTRQTFEARAQVRTLELRLPSAILGNPLAGPGGAWLPYRLDSVTDASGRPIAYARGRNELLVQLPEPLRPGQSIELSFAMSGDVLHRPGNDNYWSLFDFFPDAPRLAMAGYEYRALVKVAKPFVPFSAGSTLRRFEEGNLACAEFQQTKAIRYPVVLAGKYTTHTDARPGLVVRVSSYGFDRARANKQIANLAHAFVRFYEPLLGPFPFPELEIVEINSVGFGMAPPGMIFITREAFNPLTDYETQAYAKGINARLAHEVAHAWWGHVARPAAVTDRWISESLAEYYSGLAMGLRGEKELDRMMNEWKRQAKPVRGWGSVFLAPLLEGSDGWRDETALLYAKGPLVLHALRLELGDNPFFTVFKSLLRSFPMQDVGTRDVIGLTNHVTGRDYGPWFERYLLGTEWPPLESER